MAIVDAQIHIWEEGLPSNMAHWQVTSFPAAEAIRLMDEAEIDAAVLHPPPWDPNSLNIALKATRDWPGRFAVMGGVELEDAALRDRVSTWRETPGLLGLRFTMIEPTRKARLAAGDLDWLWAEAEAAGVPIAVMATDTLEEFGAIAERHPGLRLTIDHLGGRGGNTTLKDHEAMAHMPALLRLARHDNIAVKATGAPGYSAEAYPFPIMSNYVRQIFDAFGPARTFWGTDISKMPCSWRECRAMFEDEMDWLAGDDKRLVMGEAVRAWWGWNSR